MPVAAPPLTWLYAPASRPELVAKALESEAHAVVVDLEDAVAPAVKAEGRRTAAELLGAPLPRPAYVRINGLATGWWEADVDALAGTAVSGLVIPKVEAAADIDRLVARLPESAWSLRCLLETARGIEHAFEIASHPRVGGISIGEADLRADIGVADEGLDWARSRVVVAAVAAGLARPPQAVYTDVRDLEGLARSCAHGRALGHLGRAAIHPSQLPVIVDAYVPSEADAQDARDLVAAAGQADAAGTGGFVVDGRFVDAAVVASARATLELVSAYGTSGTGRP